MSSSDDDTKNVANALMNCKRPLSNSVNGGLKKKGEKVCNLCQLEKIPGFEDHQPLIEFQNLKAHYFCLLFSSGLGQSGQENEGLHGFMPLDVRREIKRGARLKCVYCKLKGATVGCTKQECKKSYHLPCGMKHGSLQEFFDQYKSYCCLHRLGQKVGRQKRKNKVNECGICHESITPKPGPTSILAPCCNGAWFHHKCVQTMALNHGEHHFKCPLCNNLQEFSGEMQRLGIYLPQRDALAWNEQENNASFDVSSVSSKAKECGAKVCFCDKEEGRKYNSPDGIWEQLVCHSCGSCAIHAKCGGMDDLIDPHWDCYVCRRVTLPEQELAKRRQRPINEVWGTALGRKKHASTTTATNTITNGVTISPHKSDKESNSNSPPPKTGNTVTITPIPKNQVKNHHTNFPMRSELPGGVQISMVMPLPQIQTKDTMKLSLDDIIIAGLERQPEETNYKCTKAFAEQFDQPVPRREAPGTNRHSLDTEHGSPGDSDYESSQEIVAASASGQLPFKIRKNSSPVVAIKTAGVLDAIPASINNSTPASIDSRIQKSIKDFFITS